MFSIGEFARHGRVSVRMVRHYDSVGLLRPAQVDDLTGYRWYRAEQLARLNRIVVLKELGFTLQQVQQILDEKVDVAEMHGMLRLRQAELQSQIESDSARLALVGARLEIIEREGISPDADVLVKYIPPVRVAELSASAAGFDPVSIGPVIGPLFDELCGRLSTAHVSPTGPGIAYYEAGTDARLMVHAALPVDAEPNAIPGVEIVDLPEIRQAATILHRGSMDGVLSSVQALAHWIEANGYRSGGFNRELYLAGGGEPDARVTELQEPLAGNRNGQV